jgi:hypothetical protein
VRGGDTLWDISEAYLGTPWVWPSVWQDNGEIENPHLIHPGDRIWITANQMRPVSHQEAQELVNGSPGEGLPASLDETPGITDEMAAPPRVYPVSTIDSTGLVTHSQVEGAASIIDSPAERVWLGDADPVFIGLGANQVEAGDQFTIFRTAQRVLHPESGEVYGYHVEVLGWLEVTKVEEESTVAEIRLSYAEIRRGDRILPREKMRKEIEVRSGAPLVNGQILHLPDRRTNIGSADVVFLDRGRFDGLDVGVPLEVFRPGREAPEVTRDETLQTPDWVVAKLLVVSAQEESATALVTHATTELERGDRFRTSRDGSLN